MTSSDPLNKEGLKRSTPVDNHRARPISVSARICAATIEPDPDPIAAAPGQTHQISRSEAHSHYSRTALSLVPIRPPAARNMPMHSRQPSSPQEISRAREFTRHQFQNYGAITPSSSSRHTEISRSDLSDPRTIPADEGHKKPWITWAATRLPHGRRHEVSLRNSETTKVPREVLVKSLEKFAWTTNAVRQFRTGHSHRRLSRGFGSRN